MPFIGVEPERPEMHRTLVEAERELKHRQTMQTENIYEVIEVSEWQKNTSV